MLSSSLNEEYKEFLLNNSYEGFLKKFFSKNPNEDFIAINIYSPSKPNYPLIPFRNKKCSLSTHCIYDIDEVIAFFEENDFNLQVKSNCKFCERQLPLKEFYKDHDLKVRVDKIWKKFNQKDIICTKMIIYNDGSYKAVLSKESMNPLIELKQEWKYGKLPNLISYEEEELNELIKENKLNYYEIDNEIENESESQNESEIQKKLKKDLVVPGDKIPLKDLRILYKTNEISPKIISFFCHFMTLYQKQNPSLYNKKYNNLHYFFVCKASLNTSFSKENTPKIEVLYPKKLESQSTHFLKYYRSIVFLFQLENRWFLSYYLQEKSIMFIWDFLHKTLTNITNENLKLLCEFLLSEKLGYKNKINEFSFINCKSMTFYSTKSLEVLSLTYALFSFPDIFPAFMILDQSKIKKFAKQVLWLILKISEISQEKISFFQFIEPKNIDEEKPIWKIGHQFYKKPSLSIKSSKKGENSPQIDKGKFLGRLNKIALMESTRNSDSYLQEKMDEMKEEKTSSNIFPLKLNLKTSSESQKLNGETFNRADFSMNSIKSIKSIGMKKRKTSLLSPIEAKDLSPLLKNNEKDLEYIFEEPLKPEKGRFSQMIEELYIKQNEPQINLEETPKNMVNTIGKAESLPLAMELESLKKEESLKKKESMKVNIIGENPQENVKENQEIKEKKVKLNDIREDKSEKREDKSEKIKNRILDEVFKKSEIHKIHSKNRSPIRFQIKTMPKVQDVYDFNIVKPQTTNDEQIVTNNFQQKEDNVVEKSPNRNLIRMIKNNKPLLMELLKTALQADVKERIIQEVNKEVLLDEYIFNYLMTIDHIQKSTSLSNVPSWAH